MIRPKRPTATAHASARAGPPASARRRARAPLRSRSCESPRRFHSQTVIPVLSTLPATAGAATTKGRAVTLIDEIAQVALGDLRRVAANQNYQKRDTHDD